MNSSIKIWPTIEYSKSCPCCEGKINPVEDKDIYWQGIHISFEGNCDQCKDAFLVNLPIHQGILTPVLIRLKDGKLFKEVDFNPTWYTDVVHNTINAPDADEIGFEIEKIAPKEHIIVINCLDFIFGHSLPKVFSIAEACKDLPDNYGIVVVVQPMFKWMLPRDLLAEIWTVKMSFGKAKKFYPSLNKVINERIRDYKSAKIYRHSVLAQTLDISQFTKVKPAENPKRITFVWRQDYNRLWQKYWILRIALVKILPLGKLALLIHYFKIRILMARMRRRLKKVDVQLSLAGFGTYGKFPSYVDDLRVNDFTKETERQLCQTYAESQVVIGVHGSSMIMPSAHAKMTISLMPPKRWGNFGEDVIFRKNQPRLAIYDNRILPASMSIGELIDITESMLFERRDYYTKKVL